MILQGRINTQGLKSQKFRLSLWVANGWTFAWFRADEGEMAASPPTGNIKTMTSISAISVAVKDILNVLTGPQGNDGRGEIYLSQVWR